MSRATRRESVPIVRGGQPARELVDTRGETDRHPWYGFYDLWAVERANRDSGHHFFDDDTRRFFLSRIGQTLYGGRFFVTSERSGFGLETPRRYSVRFACDDGTIDTLWDDSEAGGFLHYATGDQARRAAKRAARLWVSRLRKENK